MQLTPKEEAVLDKISQDDDLANYFFAKVSDVKWFHHLKDKGFFAPNKNPQPVESEDEGFYTIPQWPVLDYLEKISQKCTEPCNEDYANELMQIIRDVTNYRDENGEKVDNYRTWWTFTKILTNLPSKLIQLKDINLIAGWLDSRFDTPFVTDIGRKLLPKFLESDNSEDWQKVVKLIEIVITNQKTRATGNSYYLESFFSSKNCQLLGKKVGNDVMKILLEELTEIVNRKKDDEYSYTWRPAIEDHKQNFSKDSVRYVLVSALRDVLLSFLHKEDADKQTVLRELINNELNIIKRIAIFAINKNWSVYKDIFWDIFIPEQLDDSNLKHEVYWALKENFKKFDEQETRKIINHIEEGAQLAFKEKPEDTSEDMWIKSIAYWKQKWLSAIYNQGNEKVDNLYNESKKITKTDPKHPDFDFYMEWGWGGIETPFSVEELLKKTIPEIIQCLNQHPPSGNWTDPAREGLATTLQEAVKLDHKKFEAEIDPFLNVKQLYQARLIQAFEELWKNKNNIAWGKVLSFCHKVIIDPNFWTDTEPSKSGYTDRDRVVDAIAILIEEGTKSDEWAFDPQHLPLAEEILLIVNEKPVYRMDASRIDDALTAAINTTKGHIIRALINLALRKARVEDKSGVKKEVKWNKKTIGKVFDRALNKGIEPSLEFSVFMGEYLANLYYLDKSWVVDNINKIFSKENPSHWYVAMQGYLWNRPYKYLYTLLKGNSHYELALDTDLKNKHVQEQLIRHICTGFLWEIEELEGDQSLFAKLLIKWDDEEIREIIRFFWMHRDAGLDENMVRKILEFWQYCYEKLSSKEALAPGEEHIVSDLSLLTVFLSAISDENKEWLKLAASYAARRHNTAFFIEYLNELADNNPQAVGEVFWEMIKDMPHPPDYKEEDIVAIVDKLYQAGEKQKADEICNYYDKQYAGKMSNFLRPTYNKYSNRT